MLDGWLSPGSNKRPRSPVDVLHELQSSIEPDDEVLDSRHNKKRALTEMMSSGFSKLQFSLSQLTARRSGEAEPAPTQHAPPGALQALPDMSQLLQPSFGKALAAAGSLSRSNSFCYQDAIAALSQGPDSHTGSTDSPMGTEAPVSTGGACPAAWHAPGQQHTTTSSRMAAEAACKHSAAPGQHQQEPQPQPQQHQGEKLLQSPTEGPAGKMDLRRTALLRALLSKTDEHLLRRHKSEGGADAPAAPAAPACAAASAATHAAGADAMHMKGAPGASDGPNRPDPPPSPIRRHARSCGGALDCSLAAGHTSSSAPAAVAASAQLLVLSQEQGAGDTDTSDMECSSDSEAGSDGEEEADASTVLVDGRFVVPRVASLRRHTCSNDTDAGAHADGAEVTKDTLEKLRAKALAGAAQLAQDDVTEPRTERDGGAGRPVGPRGGSRRHSSHI